MKKTEDLNTTWYEAHLYASPYKSHIYGWLTATDLRKIADKMDSMKTERYYSWLSPRDENKPYIEELE